MLTSKLTLPELVKKVAAGKDYLRAHELEKDTAQYRRNADGLAILIKKLKETNIPDVPPQNAPWVVKNDPHYCFGLPNKDYLKTLGLVENNLYVPYKFDESCKLIDLMKVRGEL